MVPRPSGHAAAGGVGTPSTARVSGQRAGGSDVFQFGACCWSTTDRAERTTQPAPPKLTPPPELSAPRRVARARRSSAAGNASLCSSPTVGDRVCTARTGVRCRAIGSPARWLQTRRYVSLRFGAETQRGTPWGTQCRRSPRTSTVTSLDLRSMLLPVEPADATGRPRQRLKAGRAPRLTSEEVGEFGVARACRSGGDGRRDGGR